MKYEESDNGAGPGAWLMSFVLGGLIGAAAALLLAPKSGRQTREQIRDMAEDAKEKAEGYYDQARDKISMAMQKGAEVFQQKRDQVESTIEKGKDAYRKAKETIMES